MRHLLLALVFVAGCAVDPLSHDPSPAAAGGGSVELARQELGGCVPYDWQIAVNGIGQYTSTVAFTCWATAIGSPWMTTDGSYNCAGWWDTDPYHEFRCTSASGSGHSYYARTLWCDVSTCHGSVFHQKPNGSVVWLEDYQYTSGNASWELTSGPFLDGFTFRTGSCSVAKQQNVPIKWRFTTCT